MADLADTPGWPCKHAVLLPVLGMIAIAVPIYYLSKPPQPQLYDWFPYAALGVLVASVIYSIVLVRSLPNERIIAMARQASEAVPWGLHRMAHYPEAIEVGFSRVVLDPETQTGIYLDAIGQPIKAGKHGTGTDTNRATSTGTDGSSRGDNDSDSNPDGDQD